MTISGFSFVRNAISLDYPIAEAIRSVLPLVDEFVVACGDSSDGTTELVRSIDPKVRVIETVWDESDFVGGRVNAVQTNIALDHCRGDWCIYLQADEVIHEKYLSVIYVACEKYLENKTVEGFLFSYKHFWGDYYHYHWTHHWYRREIRVVRNGIGVRSYKSAQGFRVGDRKLRVVHIPAEIYHYGWVRDPLKMRKKMIALDTVHHGAQKARKRNLPEHIPFDYGIPDHLRLFTGTHPAVMAERIAQRNWDWIPETPVRHKHDKLWVRFRSWLEENILGNRIGEYKNYDLLWYDHSLGHLIGKPLEEVREK
ncbi:MAG: hypothetical protein DRP95_01550 [Candidatus Latescibacterota bacterium]|nr:MAG: hypothetical protein DRP95_01550 [Candidatus Latescibacterota bacterium]